MASEFKPPVGAALAKVDPAVHRIQYDEECVLIEGVVAPANQNRFKVSARAKYDVFCFRLEGWRVLGEPLVERELIVLQPVPKWRASPGAESDPAAVAECAMLRLSVLLSQNRERAVVEKILPLDSPDAELVELAERTARPLVVKTDLFGDLTLDRTLDRFEGRAEWNGRSIAVSFPRDENREIAGGLRTAEKLWADQIAWKQRVEDYAIAELLELKNENWLNDDEPPVTADEFKSRMTLTSITIENGGHLDFWHSDGDLFWGHSILVSGTLENGLIHADIPG